MSLAERLKKARINAGFKTQKDAAQKLNIRQQVLSNYENGRNSPDTEMLRELADLYNVSTDYLLESKRKPSKVEETINDALAELEKEDTLLLMKNADIDEETAKLIKQALINGIRYVDEMTKKRKSEKGCIQIKESNILHNMLLITINRTIHRFYLNS